MLSLWANWLVTKFGLNSLKCYLWPVLYMTDLSDKQVSEKKIWTQGGGGGGVWIPPTNVTPPDLNTHDDHFTNLEHTSW